MSLLRPTGARETGDKIPFVRQMGEWLSELWTRAQSSVRLGWGGWGTEAKEGPGTPGSSHSEGVGWPGLATPSPPPDGDPRGGRPRAREAASCVFVRCPPRLPPGAGADSPLVLTAVGRAAAGGCWVEASGELTEDANRPRLPPASLPVPGQPLDGGPALGPGWTPLARPAQ